MDSNFNLFVLGEEIWLRTFEITDEDVSVQERNLWEAKENLIMKS
jgi:hypothetical protein